MLCVWRGRPTECEEVVRQNVQDKLPPSNGLASSLTWPCHSPHGPCDPRPSGGARPLVCAQNAPAAPSLCRPTAGGGGAAGPAHECPASPRCRPAPPRTAATYCTHRATPRPRCVLRASVGGWIAGRGGEGWGGAWPGRPDVGRLARAQRGWRGADAPRRSARWPRELLGRHPRPTAVLPHRRPLRRRRRARRRTAHRVWAPSPPTTGVGRACGLWGSASQCGARPASWPPPRRGLMMRGGCGVGWPLVARTLRT